MSEIVMAPTKKKDAVLAYRAANPNASAHDIVKALGVNLQYVYSILRGKTTAKKGKPGRPRKVRPAFAPQVKREDLEVRSLRLAVSEHAHIVDNLKKEISELTVIIAYLEHRCFKAEGPRGPSV